MARDLISNLSDWNLVYDEQDIRGREAFSDDGVQLGTVTDLIADTDAEAIVAIVLDNGQEYPADLIDIEKDRVRVHASGMRSTGAAAAVPVVTVVADPAPTTAFSGTDAAYAGAPSASFSGTDAAFAGAAAAGTAGAYAWTDHDRDFFAARRSTYGGRAWDDTLETDLRRDYETHYGEGTWERIKAGARDGWESTKDAVSGALTSAENVLAGDGAGDLGDRDWTTDWDGDEAYFRDAHTRTYAGTAYDDYAPFYKYGYESGRRSTYEGRDWDSLESDMRLDYEGRYGEGTWERVKDSVREGFQRARNAVTGGADGARTTPY